MVALAPYRTELQGVVEATLNWYWLVDGLMAAGFAVHLANTSAIKQYEGLKYAGDERDAVFLAHLFRLGLLPEGYIYPPQERISSLEPVLDSVNYDGRLRDNYDVRSTGVIVAVSWL